MKKEDEGKQVKHIRTLLISALLIVAITSAVIGIKFFIKFHENNDAGKTIQERSAKGVEDTINTGEGANNGDVNSIEGTANNTRDIIIGSDEAKQADNSDKTANSYDSGKPDNSEEITNVVEEKEELSMPNMDGADIPYIMFVFQHVNAHSTPGLSRIFVCNDGKVFFFAECGVMIDRPDVWDCVENRLVNLTPIDFEQLIRFNRFTDTYGRAYLVIELVSVLPEDEINSLKALYFQYINENGELENIVEGPLIGPAVLVDSDKYYAYRIDEGKAVNDILYFSDEDMTEKNNGAFAEKILEKQKQIVAMVDVDGIISKYSDPEMKDFEIEETWEIYDILMGE